MSIQTVALQNLQVYLSMLTAKRYSTLQAHLPVDKLDARIEFAEQQIATAKGLQR